MSRSNTSSSEDISDNERSNPSTQNPTNFALGEGQTQSVGMSTPLPYPPHGKEAASEGESSTANSETSSFQHKSPSVAQQATGQNMSQPPDTVQPHHRIDTEHKSGHKVNNDDRQYGA